MKLDMSDFEAYEDCCDCEEQRARFWFHNGVAAEKANVAAEEAEMLEARWTEDETALDQLAVVAVEAAKENKALRLEVSRLTEELDRNEEYNAANIVKIKQAQSTYAQELVLAMNRIAVLEKKLTKRNILDDEGKLVC